MEEIDYISLRNIKLGDQRDGEVCRVSATQMGGPEFDSQHPSHPGGMAYSNLNPKEAQTRESQQAEQPTQKERGAMCKQ